MGAYCEGRVDSILGQRAKEHFLYHRDREVDHLNGLAESDRLPAFLKKAERAFKLTGEIRSKLGVKMPTAQHFKTWQEVFPEAAKRVQGSTRTE